MFYTRDQPSANVAPIPQVAHQPGIAHRKAAEQSGGQAAFGQKSLNTGQQGTQHSAAFLHESGR
jgi:hypothetical protein